MTEPESLLQKGGYPSPHWFVPGGWQELFLAAALIRTGLWDSIAETPGQTIQSLAASLGLDARATSMVLAALERAGYVAKSGDSYSPTATALSKLGSRSEPNQLRFSILHLDRLAQRWASLPEVLRTGQPLPGDRFTETVEGFVKAMDEYAAPMVDETVTACLRNQPGAVDVLDIGAATGTASKAFAERGKRVTMFDIPEVIDLARSEIKGYEGKIDLVPGDFNEALPSGPFDIAFLGNVVHIYSADHNRKLMSRVASSLKPGGLIAIQDYVRDRSPSAPFFGVNMLVNTSAGDAWTEGQYREWLASAGFGDIRVIDLTGRDQQLVLATLQE